MSVERAYIMASGREIKVGGGNPFDALVGFHTDVDIADARCDLQERAARLRSDKRRQGKQAFKNFIKKYGTASPDNRFCQRAYHTVF